MKTRRIVIASVVAAALAAVPVAPAAAAISSTTGAVVAVAAPPSVADGAYTSDTDIRVFSERVVTLSSSTTMAVWTWSGTGWTYASRAFAAGVCFESHLVHRDRVTGTSTTPLTGSVTFGDDILFIIPTNNFTVAGFTIRPLDLTDGILGSPITTYSSGIPTRGSDGSAGGDSIMQTNPTTLSLTFRSPQGDAMDEARVATLCQQPVIPEAGQVVLLSVTAVAVLGGSLAWSRHRRPTAAAV